MSFFLATKETKPWPNRVLVCSFLSDGKKRKKNLFIFTANHYNIVLHLFKFGWQTAKLSPVAQTNCKTQPGCSDKLQNSALLLRQTAKLSPVAQTNCKTQPCCSDKLQNSALLLRQTAKLSPVAWVTSMPCHAIPPCAVHELLHFKVKAQVWNKILFVKKISL